MTLICEYCGGEFEVPLSRANSARWCSWQCRADSGAHRTFARKPRTKTCDYCGSVIQSKPSKHNRFCSHECYIASESWKRRRRVQRTCGWCGATFEKRPSEVKIGRGKFCSRRCAGLGRAINGQPSAIATAAIAAWSADTDLEYVTELRLGRWSIDLALPDKQIAIELDGIYWHSLPDMIEKDHRKDAALNALGWSVVHIVMDANDTPDTIASRITETIGASV